MVELVSAALALGLAGIDPAGMLIGLSALTVGTRARMVVVFTVIVVFGTALLGTLLSLTVGRQVQTFEWSVLVPPDWVGALVELSIAIALLAWAVARLLRRSEVRPPRPRGGNRSGVALLWVGAGFAASAILDPTFVALVVLAGRDEPAAAVASAHLVWIMVSQLPLVALAVAILLGRHTGLLAWVQRVMPRARPVLAKAGTVALAAVGAVLAMDAIWWFMTGQFFLPDPT